MRCQKSAAHPHVPQNEEYIVIFHYAIPSGRDSVLGRGPESTACDGSSGLPMQLTPSTTTYSQHANAVGKHSGHFRDAKEAFLVMYRHFNDFQMQF